jgi:molybdate transport system permease protein
VVVFLVRSAGHPSEGFGVPGLFGAFATSTAAATVSSCLVGLFGVPLAYLLARGRGPLAAAAGLVVQLPLALPPLMSGVVLLYVFGPYTLFGRLTGGTFTESFAGIVVAQSFVAGPFLIVSARSAFRAVDHNLEDVAATAGLRPLARFARVALPLASGGIRAGFLLTWLRAFGEYGATVMLSYHPYSLPVFTYVQFSAIGLPATQAPALLALGLAVTVVALSRIPFGRVIRAARALLSHEGKGAAVTTPGAVTTSGEFMSPRALAATERPRAPVPVGFDLSIQAGTFWLRLRHQATSHRLAIVGHSGAGKSLTVRALAGLEPGQVSFAGRPVGHLLPEQRRVGYVPQGAGVMPHLDAWSNATFGPHADAAAASYWLTALGIMDLANRRPAQMSGGQRQRVGLARAFSCGADVVLLDEPFTGLDAPARAELLRQLRALQLGAGLSSVLVTHDFSEAALLADEVVVVSGGQALQVGPLPLVFRRPASPEVARLLGLANVFKGLAASPTSVATGPLVVSTGPHGVPVGRPLSWCVRPEHVSVSALKSEGAQPARVVDVVDLGHHLLATLAVAGETTLEAELDTPWGPSRYNERLPVPRAHDGAPAWPVRGSSCWASVLREAVLVWPGVEGTATGAGTGSEAGAGGASGLPGAGAWAASAGGAASADGGGGGGRSPGREQNRPDGPSCRPVGTNLFRAQDHWDQ